MNFLKNLFGNSEPQQEPSETDMQDFAASLITPTMLMDHDKYEKALQRKYPQLSSEEIKNLVRKGLEIFNACDKIPSSDKDFNEVVLRMYPFLSKNTITALHGAVAYSQLK